MTVIDAVAFFVALAVLAAVPSISVLAVSSRAAAAGLAHGVYTAAGVVVGDLLYIAVAIFGLALLLEALGDLFVLVFYIGGAYLIWLGVQGLRARGSYASADATEPPSRCASFMTGLLITLGDQKAILFYLGFLPAFVDLRALSMTDVGLIMLITVVAVGGVKIAYAAMARGAALAQGRVATFLHLLASGVMVGAGMVLIARAVL